MNGLKVVLYFILFFVGFLAAAVVRFETIIFRSVHSPSANFPLFLIAAVSGVFLILGLAQLDLFSKKFWKQLVYGSVTGVIFFLAFFTVEDLLSEKRLYGHPDPRSFSDVRGHCGVYVGRALIQMYHWNWSPSLSGIMGDFEMGNRCRVERFTQLVKRNQLSCQTDEDQVKCLVRWMPAFAEHGYWNAEIRKMFLAEMKRIYTESKAPGTNLKVSNESFAEYALKDYELDAARPGILKQAGLEEEFSDSFMYYKQLDEYQNVVLTKVIFDSVSTVVQTETADSLNESPLISKYKDTVKEVIFKTEKIPELEKDLVELKKRVQL